MAVGGIAGLSAVVESAVRSAAGATGVDFGFLLSTARRESGFNPLAQAGSSSAAGLFQFVEQTWMATLKRHGASHGFARYAQLIQEANGRFSVPGEEARRAVMDLRFDPNASAVMAAELAADHAAYLRGRTGREPTGGELYAAHFLGPSGSAKLIEAVRSSPNLVAAAIFPEAAAANRNVFYRDGQPLTVAQLYQGLSRTGGQTIGIPGVAAPDPGEGAFAAYAGAARGERRREQELLVDFLTHGGSGSPSHGAAGSLFTSELLTLLSDARGGAAQAR